MGGQRWLGVQGSVSEPLRALTHSADNQPHLGPQPHPLLMDQELHLNAGLELCCRLICLQASLFLCLSKGSPALIHPRTVHGHWLVPVQPAVLRCPQ